MPTFHKNPKTSLKKADPDFEKLKSSVSLSAPKLPDPIYKKPTKAQSSKTKEASTVEEIEIQDNSEENPKILKLYKTVSKIEQTFSLKTNLITLAIVSLVIFNLAFVFSRPQTNDQSQEVNAVSQKNNAPKPDLTTQKNQASLYTFQNNPAILDYGFKIDLQPNSIANVDDSNCQTPIVPPTVNGCGFALDLQKLDIPTTGIFLRSLTLETDNMIGEQKIQIDIKDYEKGEISQNVGIIDAAANPKKISLPANIPSSQSLYFRFWVNRGVVRINKVIIDYFSLQDLKPIEISLESQFKDKVSASIFQDIDEDGKYTPSKDKIWTCNPNFPGVQTIDLQNKTSVKLIRDDSCMIDGKLDSWESDSGYSALPPGKWLMVIDNTRYKSFEVRDLESKQSFNLKF